MPPRSQTADLRWTTDDNVPIDLYYFELVGSPEGSGLPIGDLTSYVTLTSQHNPATGLNDMQVAKFPTDTIALAIQQGSDSFPQYLFTTTSADGIYLGDGASNAYTNGCNIFTMFSGSGLSLVVASPPNSSGALFLSAGLLTNSPGNIIARSGAFNIDIQPTSPQLTNVFQIVTPATAPNPAFAVTNLNGVTINNLSTLYSTSGTPSGSVGVNGDFAFDHGASTLYSKASGSWTQIAPSSGLTPPVTITGTNAATTPLTVNGASSQSATTVAINGGASATGTSLLVTGGASQTGNLFEAVNNGGTAGVLMSSDGGLSVVADSILGGGVIQVQGGATTTSDIITTAGGTEAAFTAQNSSFQNIFQVTSTGSVHLNIHATGGTLSSGTGAPSGGTSGDYFFRTDTPGTTNQRIYVNNAGTWTGIV